MKRMLTAALVGLALLGAAASAEATTLLTETNSPDGLNENLSFNITAGAALTNFSFSGYNPTDFEKVLNVSLTTGGGPNLFTPPFDLTAATCGSLAEQSGYNLFFGGGCSGVNDTLSQTVSTVVGQTYTLSFNHQSGTAGYAFGPDNGLLVQYNDVIAPVPEPGTWAMLLVGVFGVGALSRIRRTASSHAA